MGQKIRCGESIKEFLTLGFWSSVLGVSVFVTSNNLINRGYKTECVFRGNVDYLASVSNTKTEGSSVFTHLPFGY